MKMWETIAKTLLEYDIKVVPPATEIGECKEEFVLLRDTGNNRLFGYSTQIRRYELLCYVPQNKYTRLEPFVAEVKKIVAQHLYPTLMPTGNESGVFFDTQIRAHMIGVQYRVSVRNHQV